MAKANTGISTTTMVAVGAGAAAVAAGAYWLYGAEGATKHRKMARSWMLKARAEIVDAIETAVEKAGELDKETYSNIVDGVLKRYATTAGVTEDEMKVMSKDMQSAWAHMKRIGKSKIKKVAKKVKKAKKKLT